MAVHVETFIPSDRGAHCQRPAALVASRQRCIRLSSNNRLRIAARGRRVTAPDVIGRSLQPIIERLIDGYPGQIFFQNGLCLNFKDIRD
jgi:hypothetical protein